MKRIEHRNSEDIFPYIEYSPETESDSPLPLIIQLHGAGERGEGKDDLSLVEAYGFSKVLETQDFPCILIMPQCPKETFWAARVESIIKFVQLIIDKYNVDPKRVSLTGSSMGGFGTWFTAMAKPDLFSAIMPCCGGGMGWNAFVLNMPVWVFHGSEDTVVNPFYSEDMVNSLKYCNKNVTYSKIDGIGHNVWNQAYTNETLNWITSQSK